MATAERPPRPRPVGVEDEYVRLPRDTSGGRRLLSVAVVVVGAIALLATSSVVWVTRQIDPPGPAGEPVGDIEIPSGASTSRIAEILAEREVISSAGVFEYWARYNDKGGWGAGRYTEFRASSSFDEAVAVLEAGPLPADTEVIRIKEGTRLQDALVEIHRQYPTVSVEEMNEALNSGRVTPSPFFEGRSGWEGLIFPDTYQVPEGATAEQLLQKLVDTMGTTLTQLGYGDAERNTGRTPYELITIASLIERETGSAEDERGKISRVIYNRLEAGEPLGIDASILYGLGRASGSLTRSDLATDTPYNNRINKGLPPTPIALPSRASLEAAIRPPEGDWRYYVLVENNPPAHLFTADYNEFVRAKRDAQNRGVF